MNVRRLLCLVVLGLCLVGGTRVAFAADDAFDPNYDPSKVSLDAYLKWAAKYEQLRQAEYARIIAAKNKNRPDSFKHGLDRDELLLLWKLTEAADLVNRHPPKNMREFKPIYDSVMEQDTVVLRKVINLQSNTWLKAKDK